MPHREYIKRIKATIRNKEDGNDFHSSAIWSSINHYKVAKCKSCIDQIKKLRSGLGQRKK